MKGNSVHLRTSIKVMFGVGVAGLLAATSQASAQVSFDLLTRFALGWGEEAVPINGKLQISKPGVYQFELQEGVFNAAGFTNYGVGNWIGYIQSSESGLGRPANPRPSPFNTMGFNGDINAQRTLIGTTPQNYIDAAHPWEIYHYTETPPLPPAVGAEEYVGVYRFTMEITDMTPREISISADAPGLSRPLSGYTIFQHIPPDPETGEPGMIRYHYSSLNATFAQPTQLSLTFLQIVPGPGAAGVMAGGVMLMAGRRRRAV
jgi:hypothetical protein